ncbi:DUF262 domain-containing protein [Aeromonas sp. BIGb0445]|uniref:DUF262 domain-containing protein n=1 Tax=Aeromonas sp. BIGb0445 TaxID=2940593 RepID=UPI0021681BE6|nr:DUF262 domain-containing protein [Aeromonas sp. BIGb0445]MCS3460877.1 hypothetical protein [Aeromonas sp. BIGb0445]
MSDTNTGKLGSSIPANNQKIIEIYNKIRSSQLVVNTEYQRKLVWKKPHKIKFIDTILNNYPFPEVYFSQGNIDPDSLVLVDEIVDGQQRLMTIKDYIECTDVFSPDGSLSIPRFNELDPDTKKSFLNYEISVRYLKNVTLEQVREIFQRINKTDYSLNVTEKLNAQYGYSEFICFAKQMIGEDIDVEGLTYIMSQADKDFFVNFFLGQDGQQSIFSDSDISRMQALQYIMTLVATICHEEYFSRNTKTNEFIKVYNDYFPQAEETCSKMRHAIDFIQSMEIARISRWYNKASLFSLIVELADTDLGKINAGSFSGILNNLEKRALYTELGISDNSTKPLTSAELEFFNLSREAVNEKLSREKRGEFIRGLISMANIE